MSVALVVVLRASLLPQTIVQLDQPVDRMAVLMFISGVLATSVRTRGWDYAFRRALDLMWLLLIWTPITLLALYGPRGIASLGSELVNPMTHLGYVGALAVSAGCALWSWAGGTTGQPGYDKVLHFSFFFYAGLYGCRYWVVALERCGAKVGWGALVAIVLLFATPVPHSALTLGSAAAMILIAQGLAASPLGVALAWIGRQTPAIYLAHAPLLVVLGRINGSIGLAELCLLSAGVILLCLMLRDAARRAGLTWLYECPPVASLSIARSVAWLRVIRRGRSMI